jgi:hypothetical protein
MSEPAEAPGTLAVLTRLVADRAANPARHLAKICFFLEAGADLSSGGISFSELKRQASEQFAKRQLFNITRPEEIEAHFESLFAQQTTDDKALLVDCCISQLIVRTRLSEAFSAHKRRGVRSNSRSLHNWGGAVSADSDIANGVSCVDCA